MGLTQTVVPVEEPVPLFRLKEWMKIHPEIKEDDGLVYELARAAREMIEGLYSLQLVTATWKLTVDSFDAWDGTLPVVEVTAVSSIKYREPVAGTLTTLDSSVYEVVLDREPALVRLAYEQEWPDVRDQADAVEVIFTAGFGTGPQVPGALKTAIMVATAAWYLGREDAGKLPEGARSLVSRYCNGRLSA